MDQLLVHENNASGRTHSARYRNDTHVESVGETRVEVSSNVILPSEEGTRTIRN